MRLSTTNGFLSYTKFVATRPDSRGSLICETSLDGTDLYEHPKGCCTDSKNKNFKKLCSRDNLLKFEKKIKGKEVYLYNYEANSDQVYFQIDNNPSDNIIKIY